MSAFRSILLLAFGALLVCAPVSAETAADRHLTVVTASGPHDFSVEVMRTQPELERGLMFRKTMPQSGGMLFDFGRPQDVAMWMKNTTLPLDMLFIGQDGRVVSVKEDAEPMSEAVIASGGPVTGVLEVNAGTVKRIGAKPGDHVRHPMFKE